MSFEPNIWTILARIMCTKASCHSTRPECRSIDQLVVSSFGPVAEYSQSSASFIPTNLPVCQYNASPLMSDHRIPSSLHVLPNYCSLLKITTLCVYAYVWRRCWTKGGFPICGLLGDTMPAESKTHSMRIIHSKKDICKPCLTFSFLWLEHFLYYPPLVLIFRPRAHIQFMQARECIIHMSSMCHLH